MPYILTVLASVASAMLAFILQSVIKENHAMKKEREKELKQREKTLADREKALENGVVCLLRTKLIEYHSKYTKLDKISSHAYENWGLMYDAYKSLGGNGMIDHMKEEIEELHIKNI